MRQRRGERAVGSLVVGNESVVGLHGQRECDRKQRGLQPGRQVYWRSADGGDYGQINPKGYVPSPLPEFIGRMQARPAVELALRHEGLEKV